MTVIREVVSKGLPKLAGIFSLLLNLMPFLIYVALIQGHHELLTAALPFAIYYGFRRAGLLLFRDFEYDYQRLAWIGIYSGICGYALGMLGGINPVFFDLSGVGAGLASALFPAAVSQRNRLVKNGLLTKLPQCQPLVQFVIVLAFLGCLLLVKKPLVHFGLMLLVSLGAAGAYWKLPHSIHSFPVRLHWYNYSLALILLAAMLLLRLGRSMGIGQPAQWGLGLLLTFIIVIALGLLFNHQHLLSYPHNLRAWILLYGVCGQYWTLYSTIFIGVIYGVQLYYWTIVAYLLAFIFGARLVNEVTRISSAAPERTALVMLTLGIILTFWLPTYFIGIFIIRSFAGEIRKQTIGAYEQATRNYTISSIVNNYYSMISGVLSQLVMWGSLFLSVGLKGMNHILGAFSLHQPDMQNGSAITLTHLVLAVYMILYLMWLLLRTRKQSSIFES